MNVQGVNQNQVTWQSLLNAINESSGVKGTQGVESGEKTNVVFTTTIDGMTQQVSLPIPDDLELPSVIEETSVDAILEKFGGETYLSLPDAQRAQIREQLKNALAKLNAAAEVAGSAAVSSGGGTGKVLFDLYQLMALLVEVAQQQRNSARDLRLAQSQQIQASIQAQADQQMFAAWLGIGLSIATAAVQVAVTGVSMAKTQSAYNDKIDTSINSGVPAAQQNMQMVRAADNSANAGQQLSRVDHSIGDKRFNADGGAGGPNDPTIRQTVQRTFNSLESHSNQALNRLTNAQDTLAHDTAYQSRVNDMNVNNATTEGAIANMRDGSALKEAATDLKQYRELSAVENPSPEQQDQLTALQGKYGANSNAELQTRLEAKVEGEIANEKTYIEQKIATDNTGVENGRIGYRNALKADIRTFEDAYNAAQAERTQLKEIGASKSEIAAADKKVQKAAMEMQYARAYGNDKLMGSINNTPITTEVDHAADLKQATDAYDAAEAARRTDIGGIKADRKLSFWEGISQVNNAIGGMLQGVNQSVVSLEQAKATRIGAEQERLREELEQIKDLFSQAQDVINAAVQLMQAVRSAEVQSMRDAIQA